MGYDIDPWPFVLTTSAVAQGAVFLLGASAPIDALYIDGHRLRDFVSMVAGDEQYLEPDFPRRAISVVARLPARVGPGDHWLRVVRGSHSWRQRLVVTALPAPHGVEVGVGCSRPFRDDKQLVFFWFAPPLVRNFERFGVIVQDAVGARIVPNTPGLGDTNGPEDYVPPDPMQAGTVVQLIYPDGSVGERWQFSDDNGDGDGCHKVSNPLPGGPGIPLWVDDGQVP